MKQKLLKVFRQAKYEPSDDLAEDVWSYLMARNQRIIRFRLWAVSLVGISSLGGLVPMWQATLSNLAQSGFYEYFSLIFSDSRLVLSYWREFTFSLAESLPTMSIIMSLALVFIFFISLKYAMQNMVKSQLSF